jgi:hypothetical protein
MAPSTHSALATPTGSARHRPRSVHLIFPIHVS